MPAGVVLCSRRYTPPIALPSKPPGHTGGFSYNCAGARIGCGMSIWEMILVALAVSMDAFAVSICRGLALSHVGMGETLCVGAWFGSFQALMPALGGALMYFCRHLSPVTVAAPYIAAALLFGIGGNMLREALSREEKPEYLPHLSQGELCLLAVATSIDAFASGIAMACSVTVSLAALACAMMGGMTFLLCCIGVRLGDAIGAGHGRLGEIFGGIALFLLGLKMLLEALGVLSLPV